VGQPAVGDERLGDSFLAKQLDMDANNVSDGTPTSQGVTRLADCDGKLPEDEALPGGNSLEQQMLWLRQKVGSLEDQLQIARRDRTEAEHRAYRLNEQMDRLWQEIADERRERQVEANEERMMRLSETAEIRNDISRVKPRLREFSNDASCLETFVEEPEEPEDDAPELTALNDEEDGKTRGQSRISDAASSGGISEATLAAARHAEAQLKRAAADARRAEAMVRREVARSVAEARSFLEDSGQQQQDFWAARQKAAEKTGGHSEDDKTGRSEASIDCLTLRLDSLEYHVRARLEAAEAIQNSIDDIQNMPAQVGRLIREEIEELRKEFEVAMTEERARAQARVQVMARDLMREIERSIVDQAVAEVRAEVAVAARNETGMLREELSRARSDEASRQGMRIHALEERISSLENMSSRTKMGEEIVTPGGGSTAVSRAGSLLPDPAPAVALQQFGESVAQLESTIGGLLRKSNEQRTEYQADSLKFRKEMDEINIRMSHLSTGDVGELQQRLSTLEDRLRRSDARPWREAEVSSGDEGLKCRLARLEEALEKQSSYLKTSKSCVAEVMHRLSSVDPDAARRVVALYPEVAAKPERQAGVARASSEEPPLRYGIAAGVPLQGGSMGQLPVAGYGTPCRSSNSGNGGSMVLPPGQGSSVVQRRPGEPVPSPGVPNNQGNVQVEPLVLQAASWNQATGSSAGRAPSQATSVQRSWSVPMARGVPPDNSANATVKVMPPGLMGSTAVAPGKALPSPVQSQTATPFSQSLAAPAASATSLQLRPRAVSPQHASPMIQSSIRSPQQKPTDSPYMRYRAVKLQASSSNLPGRPVAPRS